jgi:hypothetical protein
VPSPLVTVGVKVRDDCRSTVDGGSSLSAGEVTEPGVGIAATQSSPPARLPGRRIERSALAAVPASGSYAAIRRTSPFEIGRGRRH